MNNDRNLRKPLLMSLIFIFMLTSLVLLLATLASGLLWCSPPISSSAASVSSAGSSPVGTWVTADSWENGYSPDDVVIEFTDSGLMSVSSSGFSALYRYEDSTLYLLDMNTGTPDDSGYPSADNYKCTITGDHMSLQGRISGIMSHHGRCDLIRISDSTGLSAEEIASLY